MSDILTVHLTLCMRLIGSACDAMEFIVPRFLRMKPESEASMKRGRGMLVDAGASKECWWLFL